MPKPKTYFHVFARNRRTRRSAEVSAWFHEISLDSRDDADAEKENLTFHGYTVKIVKGSGDPVVMVRMLNADLRASAILNRA